MSVVSQEMEVKKLSKKLPSWVRLEFRNSWY